MAERDSESPESTTLQVASPASLASADREFLVSASDAMHLRAYLSAVWKDGIALMSGGIGVALAFLAVYFAFIANHSIAVLWLAALFAFAYAGYRVWRQQQIVLGELEERQRPKLVIVYNGGEFNHDEYVNGQIVGRIIRLGIKNDSDSVVSGVRVEAYGFINATGTLLPGMPLQITNDHGNLKANGFSINPRDTERVDLIKKACDGPEMYLASSVPGVNVGTQQDEIELKVAVSGETSPQQARQFSVRVNSDGLLECEEK